MRNHEILYLFAGEGFLSFPCLTLCITNTGERQTSPRYFNLLKSLAEFAACGGKESQKNFPPGRGLAENTSQAPSVRVVRHCA